MAESSARRALQAAVIGLGTISEQHRRFLGARRDARLVGVCDLSL